MLFKDISYLELWRHFCSAQPNHLCNFGRGHYEEHICGIMLNLDRWLRTCLLKVFLSIALGRSGTIYAILVEGIMRNKICEII